MMQQIEAARALVDFDDVIVVSATEGFNVEPSSSSMASYLPEGPRWYPEGMDTDTDDATLVAEFVREKVLLRTREEVPHSVGVVCDSFERSRKLVRVHATVYVERDGQKGILIGRKGEMIKHIGTDARHDLERLFGRKVYLELDVKVKAGLARRCGRDPPHGVRVRGVTAGCGAGRRGERGGRHGRFAHVPHACHRARQGQAQRDRPHLDAAGRNGPAGTGRSQGRA